ncbi:MAG: tRNA (guanosine(46)-N7)-methyltransferase TrmB [Synergistaceae bacterium]|nr:tRNA (guanosine(46)-N7)-methyltransferase TrmB [Synergistaceae bacterium]
MDVLAATTQAKPQYRVILTDPELPLETPEHSQLEIGFGNGEFTVQYAQAHPEIMLYGVEISGACVLKCARRAGGLPNLRIINTDARYMLRELFRDESLERIYMQFPCPWSKTSDAHRRVTAKDFADGLAAVLRVGGVFEMLTDDEPYSLEVKSVLGKHDALSLTGYEVSPKRTITTKYERKWLDEGKNIYRVLFTKTGAFTVRRRISEEMHIKIRNTAGSQELAALRNIEGYDDSHKAFWKFGRYFADGDTYLLETLTSDDEFRQDFYIMVLPRDGGSLLRLDKTAKAFLTPAVRAALSDAAHRLNSGAAAHEGS